MKKSRLFATFVVLMTSFHVFAGIAPTATYMKDGSEVTVTAQPGENPAEITEEAPLRVSFKANASSLEANTSLEWHFRHVGAGGSTNITRYEEDTEYTFTESGQTLVSLYICQDNEVVDSACIKVTISESHLEMPNAFSPNGDGHNEKYGAKGVNSDSPDSDGHYKSIVEFHAYIFNRWGQKLYEWDDVAGYWDGTYNGHPVKDGVYFVLVKARGADGIEYNIRRDVNLIRNYNQETSSSSGTDE